MPVAEKQDRVDRLPKWARDRIGQLEREVAYFQAKLSEGPEDSDTFLDPHADAPRPLGCGGTVRFVLRADERGAREYVDVRLDRADSFLVVRGSDGLAVFPAASNSLFVKLARP